MEPPPTYTPEAVAKYVAENVTVDAIDHIRTIFQLRCMHKSLKEDVSSVELIDDTDFRDLIRAYGMSVCELRMVKRLPELDEKYESLPNVTIRLALSEGNFQFDRDIAQQMIRAIMREPPSMADIWEAVMMVIPPGPLPEFKNEDEDEDEGDRPRDRGWQPPGNRM